MDKNIYLTHWGDSGPRVVLIHGSVQGSTIGGDKHFARQKELASLGWQLAIPDRPGHGRSPDPGRPDDAGEDAKWVCDLLDGGAHLVGHSFGGCVALAAAASAPDKVRSLTLIEPGMLKIAMHDVAVRRFAARMLAAMYLSFSPAQRATRFARLVGIPEEVGSARDRAERERVGRALKKIRIPGKEVLSSELSGLRDARMPLLVVTGGWNAAFERTADEVARIGNGERLVIDSPHHFPNLSSDRFNRELASFMRVHQDQYEER